MRYVIEGENLPVVICYLQNGESMITEKGAMSWMTPNITMETGMDGGLGRAIGRAFSGESMFMNHFTCHGGEGMIAFASSFPGRILALPIAPGNNLIVQKTAFLAAERSVQLSTHFSRKLSTGFFGGEGFIMQKLSGNGTAFVEIDGHVAEYELAPGQSLLIDSGHLAAMTESVQMTVETVKGLKNMVFGGEGLFNTRVTGPGHVWLQTMPFSKLAGELAIGKK